MPRKSASQWQQLVERLPFSIIKDAPKNKDNLYFIELTFDSKLFSQIGYRQYNFDSPWYIPMQMKPREATYPADRGSVTKTEPGFRLERDKKFGTVPSFKWRGEHFGDEYKVPEKYGN